MVLYVEVQKTIPKNMPKRLRNLVVVLIQKERNKLRKREIERDFLRQLDNPIQNTYNTQIYSNLSASTFDLINNIFTN